MTHASKVKHSLAALAALFTLGCEGIDEQAEDALAQAAAPSLDGGIVAPGLDGDASTVAPDGGSLRTVAVTAIKAFGRGCPAGTWSSEVGAAVVVRFDQFYARVPGSAVPPSVDCTLNIEFRSSQPLQFLLSEVALSSRLELGEGATGFHESSYSFAGVRPNPARVSSTGPASRDYEFRHGILPEANTWSRCGLSATLTVNLRAGVTGPDTAQGSVRLKELRATKFAWKVCP